MFEHEDDDDEAWKQHRRTVRQHLEWTPVVANGSLLLSLFGIIGSAGDPDRAMWNLTVPLLWFGGGAALGLVAAQRSLEMQHQSIEAARRHRQLNEKRDEMLADGRLKERTVDIAKAPPDLVEPIQTWLDARSKAMMLEMRSGFLRWCSLAVCMAGFLGLIGGHLFGAFRLQ